MSGYRPSVGVTRPAEAAAAAAAGYSAPTTYGGYVPPAVYPPYAVPSRYADMPGFIIAQPAIYTPSAITAPALLSGYGGYGAAAGGYGAAAAGGYGAAAGGYGAAAAVPSPRYAAATSREPPIPTPDLRRREIASAAHVPLRMVVLWEGKYQSLVTVIIALGPMTLAEITVALKDIRDSIAPRDVSLIFFKRNHGLDPALTDGEKEALQRSINSYYGTLSYESKNHYSFFTDIINDYNDWRAGLETEMARERIILGEMILQERQLAEMMRDYQAAISPITVTKITPVLRVTINGRPVTTEDGYEIFNSAVVSDYVPYIRYSSPSQNIHKIYRGESSGRHPPYDVITQKYREYRQDTIDIVFWKGLKGLKGSKQPKEGFSNATLCLTDGDLSITLLSKEFDEADEAEEGEREGVGINRVKRALPLLKLDSTDEVSINARFTIYDVHFFDLLFIDYIMNDPLFSRHFYVNEVDNTIASKIKRMEVHYRGSNGRNNAIFTVKMAVLRNNATDIIPPDRAITAADIIKPTSALRPAPPVPPTGRGLLRGDLAVTVEISHVSSYQQLEEMTRMIRLLFSQYNRDYTHISTSPRPTLPSVIIPTTGTQRLLLYYLLVPDITTLEQQAIEKALATKVGGENAIAEKMIQDIKGSQTVLSIPFLKEAGSFSRTCQKTSRPIRLQWESVATWERETITREGVEYKRRALPFPSINNPEYWLGCPDPGRPFLSFRANRGKHADKYPYFPCCLQSPPRSRTFEAYMTGKPPPVKTGAVGGANAIQHNKSLAPGVLAIPSRYIAALLERGAATGDGHRVNIVRYGVVSSRNSLLHCACRATEDASYLRLLSDAAREEYVAALRSRMTADIAVYRQELYDRTDTEIKQAIHDPEVFLDPSLYYRGVEELFRINIYNYGLGIKKGSDPLGSIIVPRYRLFHVRPINIARQTMCITTHIGGEAEKLAHPVCELLADQLSSSRFRMLFGETMTVVVHDALMRANTVYTWFAHEYAIATGLPPPSTTPVAEESKRVGTVAEESKRVGTVAEESKRAGGTVAEESKRAGGTVAEESITTASGSITTTVAPLPRTRRNIYSQIDFAALFQHRINGQYIDEYGKLRAVVLRVGEVQITVIVPISQPLNVPAVTLIDLSVNLPTMEAILRLFTAFPPITSVTTAGDRIVGIWYPLLGVAEGLHLPVLPTPIPSTPPYLLTGSVAPLAVMRAPSLAQQSRQIRRVLRFILALVDWVFDIYRTENTILGDVSFAPTTRIIPRGTPMAAELFDYAVAQGDPPMYDLVRAEWTLENSRSGRYSIAVVLFERFYTTTGTITTGSADVYDISAVPRRLPALKTVKEALTWLGTIFHSFTRDGKLWFYNTTFHRGVMRHLDEYYKRVISDEPIIPDSIANYYLTADDYHLNPRTSIFIGEADLSRWLAQHTAHLAAGSQYLFKKLELSFATDLEPYIYEHQTGRMYIIQNVAGVLDDAIYVSVIWSTKRINVGSHATSNILTRPYHQYAINTHGEAFLERDESQGADNPVEVLRYNLPDRNRFAAMLRLR